MQQQNIDNVKVENAIEDFQIEIQNLKLKLGSLNLINVPSNELYTSSIFYNDSNIDITKSSYRQRYSEIQVQQFALKTAKFVMDYSIKILKKKIGKDSFTDIIQEFECLYLHCIDAITYNLFEKTIRLELMDDLCIDVIKSNIRHDYLLMSKIKKNELAKAFLNKYNKKTLFYSRYNVMLPEFKESTIGTLLWDFSKNISQKIEANMRLDFIYPCIVMIINNTLFLNEILKTYNAIFFKK